MTRSPPTPVYIRAPSQYQEDKPQPGGPVSVNYLFVDMNSYFASVEQQLDPGLRGKPVAVAPVDAETTSCIAASYEAKRFAVRTGTKIAEGRRMCAGLLVVQARPEVYVQMH